MHKDEKILKKSICFVKILLHFKIKESNGKFKSHRHKKSNRKTHQMKNISKEKVWIVNNFKQHYFIKVLKRFDFLVYSCSTGIAKGSEKRYYVFETMSNVIENSCLLYICWRLFLATSLLCSGNEKFLCYTQNETILLSSLI